MHLNIWILLIQLVIVAITSGSDLAQAIANAPYAKQTESMDDLNPWLKNQNIDDFSSSMGGQNSTIIESMPSLYSNSQASKLKVNVSNVCEKNQMRVTIRISKPFYGLIHAKERRKKPACFVQGNGEQIYSIDISYVLLPADPNYCGVVSHHLSGVTTPSPPQTTQISQKGNEKQTTLSVVLVVRLHKTIEFSDDRYFLLSCANRCEKPDCTPDITQRVVNKIEQVNQRVTFATSESVVSPVLRPTIGGSLESNKSNKLAIPDNSQLNWSTEKCDLMLDMKFQWLLKLCWVLAFLLILMFCVAFYLCLTISGQRKSRILNKNDRRSTSSSRFTTSVGRHNKPVASYANSENLSCSNSSGTNATTATLPTTITSSEELMKIREDNSFLAQQNQQLMLANLLAANSNSKIDFTNYNSSRANNYDHVRRIQNHTFARKEPILGRSLDPKFSGSHNQRQPGTSNVKRRRSIGSSAAPILVYDSNANRYTKSNASKPLESNHRTKSRSQTTIHYDQSQDPFKAVPFNYLNSGYLSDGATSQQVYLASNNMESDYNNQFYSVTNQQQNISDALCQSLPVENIHFQTHSLMQPHQPKRWNNYPNKPTFVPPPIPKQDKDMNNNRQVNSQFDPQQNSNQLIDLIQQKHRQQIEQANRTAAGLVGLQPEQHQAVDSRRGWR